MNDHPPADTDAIHRTLYRYAELVDAGDFGAVGALFADADIVVGDDVVGHGADFVEGMLRAMVILYDDGTPRTRHLISNPIIEFADADSARIRSCYTVLQPRDGRIEVIAVGRHHDTMRRTGDGWAFTSRDYGLLDFTGDTSGHLRGGTR
ncbi:nuclear transport factor 2 family protein [Gordonia insulae]|uniref:3-phenylpropionate/cinnamic acid dioxygenase subunit beta n=1 Tax=Gordonia insulae TaxID=2420509 RepID=A0A3G8JRN2_9ACTN|nr:nuclear transport factor 2 family protein [Gordonia insulae]AZG46840.1 3-phenylpropionate/cinnamic acid dioxygenase subunit beta [Gordonia insulae]